MRRDVGPENPYVSKDIYPTDSIDFYIFDLSRKNWKEHWAFTKLTSSPRSTACGRLQCLASSERIGLTMRSSGLWNGWEESHEGISMKDPENKAMPVEVHLL